jgi:arabinofuranosyltransferase
LLVAASAVLLGVRARVARTRGAWLAMLPLLATLAHLAWRRATYGQWLPNTYYAKHVEAWPAGGLVYAASFVWEYAYFFWIVAALAAARRTLRTGRLGGLQAGTLAVIVVLALQAGYYTLVIGGDHFEYRIYHHLVPLTLLSFPWLCGRLGWSARRTVAGLVLMLAVGSVLPWLHWWHTHTLTARGAGGMPHYRVARHLPLPARWYGEVFDGLQGFLIEHFSGLRHQSHKNFASKQLAAWPSRAEGGRIPGDGLPVLAETAVGVPGWVLPHVAVIDLKGLNDAVIARSPTRASAERALAHDRSPPPGYVDCFRPNVVTDGKGGVTAVPRREALAPADVVRCEADWRARVGAP